MSSPAAAGPSGRARMGRLTPRLAPRLAEEAVERVRLSVVPRTRRRRSRVPFVALVTLIMLGGVVGLLLFNTSMQQASFATTALQGQADALTAQQQTLTMQLDEMRDPQRVAEAARRLGMVPDCAPMFLKLGSGSAPARILGQPAPTTTACAVRVAPYPALKPRSLVAPPTIVTVPAVVTRTPAQQQTPTTQQQTPTTQQEQGQTQGQTQQRQKVQQKQTNR